MNSVNLIGNMVRDFDLRRTKDGKAAGMFTIAVNNYNQDAYFFNCVVWGKLAENMDKYTRKGSKVAVSGYLSQRTYENANKQKVSVVEVVATNVSFLNKIEKEDSSKDGEYLF